MACLQSYTLRLAALGAVIAEWTNPRHSLAARIASLGGVTPPGNRLNGNYFLTDAAPQATVATDSEADYLGVMAGRDWWLADLVQDLVAVARPKKR